MVSRKLYVVRSIVLANLMGVSKLSPRRGKRGGGKDSERGGGKDSERGREKV